VKKLLPKVKFDGSSRVIVCVRLLGLRGYKLVEMD
jgi:hypothetical protein